MTMGNSDDENGEICLTENKPAVKEDVARGSPCVKRLLQQVDYDSRCLLTCHLLAFM